MALINESTRDNFEIRFYKWAAAEWIHEVELDFPLVRSIPNAFSRRFTRAVDKLAKDDQFRLARALTKRAHERGARLAGERLNEDDRVMLQVYPGSAFTGVVPGEEALYNPFSLAALRRPEKREFGKLLRAVLKPLFGGDYETLEGSKTRAIGWRYYQRIDHWMIVTDFDLKGGSAMLNYSHRIRFSESEWDCLVTHTSPFQWLGIGATEWNPIEPVDPLDIAEHCRELCAYFVTAASKLLRDL